MSNLRLCRMCVNKAAKKGSQYCPKCKEKWKAEKQERDKLLRKKRNHFEKWEGSEGIDLDGVTPGR